MKRVMGMMLAAWLVLVLGGGCSGRYGPATIPDVKTPPIEKKDIKSMGFGPSQK